MSIEREHDVVEFEIPIDDAILMEVFKSEANLSSIEPSDCFSTRQSLPFSNLLCTFAAKLSTLNV